ncbi:MAG: OmpH family outer membrane protein [Paludibacteraceae bacterium]|nr:OmpH family outer membrane protein [Paludibacteraceae bacterium]
MKKILLLFMLAVAVVACGKKEEKEAKESEKSKIHIVAGDVIPIAVVNVDTILAQYNLATEANEMLMNKQEDVRLELSQRARALNNDMVNFQNKMENNAFLNRQRAENEYARLQKRQQELETYEGEKTQELLDEQQRVSQEVKDSINSAIAVINSDGRYHLIITTSSLSDNVLYCADEYDITNEVVELLNERYKSKK